MKRLAVVLALMMLTALSAEGCNQERSPVQRKGFPVDYSKPYDTLYIVISGSHPSILIKIHTYDVKTGTEGDSVKDEEYLDGTRGKATPEVPYNLKPGIWLKAGAVAERRGNRQDWIEVVVYNKMKKSGKLVDNTLCSQRRYTQPNRATVYVSCDVKREPQ